MRFTYLVCFIIFFVTITSCRKDFTTELSNGKLQFSKDTLFLDTVFNGISSSTYTLKVYNKSNNAINIPSVKLGNGETSMYRLNVDGNAGKSFSNVEILAKDSIYIFIETTIDVSKTTDPLYTDSIIFESDNHLQDVKLVTLVKDAHFLFPSKNSNGVIETITINENDFNESLTVQGFYLNNTTFTNEKPYVIYSYCVISEGKNLTIDAGAQLFFHANSGLIISKNATLIVNGTLENKVVFEGDRLEHLYSNIPGQWGAIWLQAGSKNNFINNTIIKNASVGILVDSIGNSSTPTLTIKNSEIYNSSNFGLLGRETNIKGENIVINNAGQSALGCTAGGTYNFTHSTFANFWNSSPRRTPCVVLNNYLLEKGKNLHAANFTNCIIDGSNSIEFTIDKVEGFDFNFSFKNNLLKFDDFNKNFASINEYNFSNLTYYENNIFNGRSHFKSTSINKLIIGEKSDAIKKGNPTGTSNVPIDILGKTRSNPADLGAYEHIIFEN